MATLADRNFYAKLQALADKFAARVPETMAGIARVLAACAADGITPERLREIQELLHGIAGSAGTFGFAVLGREARRLEQQARIVQAGQAEWAPLSDELACFLRWATRDPKADRYDDIAKADAAHD